MIDLQAALDCVVAATKAAKTERLGIEKLRTGDVLAAATTAQENSPPFDKSLRDGFAIRVSDLEAGASFEVVETVHAGAVPTRSVEPGTATRIMTGAPMPEGADCVVMVEHSRPFTNDDGTHRVLLEPPHAVSRGDYVLRAGAVMQAGSEVLAAGTRITPMVLGLLAELGEVEPLIFARPRVAVLTTGNELVPPSQTPGPGQIRNSNKTLLEGLIRDGGFELVWSSHASDEAQELSQAVGQALAAADVVFVTGGVSAGDLDLVPATLAEHGVETIFHKVNIKPGRPLWFGERKRNGEAKLVFGLPGNPVSVLATYVVFGRLALARLSGLTIESPDWFPVRLNGDYEHRGDRATLHPARLHRDTAGLVATPGPWQGSPDLHTLTQSQALLHFTAGNRTYKAASIVSAVWLNHADGGQIR
jgi:molybdopterin molybdotransferase